MGIEIKKMESDEEIKGKAYVHWKSWQDAYKGTVNQSFRQLQIYYSKYMWGLMKCTVLVPRGYIASELK
jgi:hypothetical protein